MWAAYVRFFNENLQFNHRMVNHSRNFVDQTDRDVHTQSIEGLWSRLKWFLRSKSLRRRDHLELYLAEFVFRRNRTHLGGQDLFELLIELIINQE